MEVASLPNLDGLAEIGLRGGVDMRPTLVRVLTDLYVQKLTHTPEEERHYTELALRLLDSVDVPTRAAVAARLSRHLSPPPRVVQYFLDDLPEIAAALRAHASVTAAPAPPARPPALHAPADEERRDAEPAFEPIASDTADGLDAARARDLNEQFFAATADERRLILLNLHVVAPVAAGRVRVAREPDAGKRLEAAALARRREDLAAQLTQSLHIAHEQARRIVRDDLGEPIIVAAKALGIARDVLHRILLFFNPLVGHSVHRVRALADLYDDMTLPAAEGMVAIWQALPRNSRAAAKHQPLFWNDERSRARPPLAARRSEAAPQRRERRDAS